MQYYNNITENEAQGYGLNNLNDAFLECSFWDGKSLIVWKWRHKPRVKSYVEQ